jgi:hypothetical protein
VLENKELLDNSRPETAFDKSLIIKGLKEPK